MSTKKRQLPSGDALDEEFQVELAASTAASKKKRTGRARPDKRSEGIEHDRARMRRNAVEWVEQTFSVNLSDGDVDANVVFVQTQDSLARVLETEFPAVASLLRKQNGAQITALPASQGVLVVTSSAARATQLTREIRSLRKGMKVSQLYAKHYKTSDQKEFLSKHKWCPAAVGTPHRMCALAAEGVWGLRSTQLCVLECTPDAKMQRLWSMPEVRKDLDVLFKKHIHEHLRRGAALLLFDQSPSHR